jgi:hypothetical protein
VVVTGRMRRLPAPPAPPGAIVVDVTPRLSTRVVGWALVAAVAATTPAAQSTTTVTAFVEVGVIPMDVERVLPRHTVLVRDGRIAWVGPAAAAQIPPGAARIDGRGRFLLPGLVDMHVHIAPARGTPATPPAASCAGS